VNQTIRQVLERIVTVLDNIGLPYSGINLSYSNAGTIGSSDVDSWQQGRALVKAPAITSMTCASARAGISPVQFFFQPADIVTQILNFELRPIDVASPARTNRANYAVAQKLV
jgi:hypothetical protein